MQNLQYNPWLIHLMTQLLASDRYSPVNVVLSVGGNPFPDAPPRFIKADLYRYKFTRLGEGFTIKIDFSTNGMENAESTNAIVISQL